MLGLTTHEPHFSLLREEVRFGGKKDKNRRYVLLISEYHGYYKYLGNKEPLY